MGLNKCSVSLNGQIYKTHHSSQQIVSIDVTKIYCMSKWSGPQVKPPLVARDVLVNGLKLRTDAAVRCQTVTLALLLLLPHEEPYFK